MKKSYTTPLLIVLLTVFITTAAKGQFLDGKNRIEIRFGGISHSYDSGIEIGSQGVGITTGTTGIMTVLSYSRYIQENLAVTFSIMPIITDNGVTIDLNGVDVGTNSVTPIFLGARYYPFKSTYGRSLRPFLSLSAGPVIGSEQSTSVGTDVLVDSHTETAFGARAGLGLDILLSGKFILGFDTGYDMMTDFNKSIGGEDNYSGADFSFGLSFLFGGGRTQM